MRVYELEVDIQNNQGISMELGLNALVNIITISRKIANSLRVTKRQRI